MTRVLVADDHTLFRQGLRRLLSDALDLEVTGEAGSGREALARARENSWDLMLLDISLPDLGGLEVLRQMRLEGSSLPVLMLSMHPAERFAAEAARLGAAGYISKDCSSLDLIEAMRRVSGGGSYLEERHAHALFFHLARGLDEPPHHRLSPRELQVFMSLARGHTIARIAADMGINAKTVSTYRARLLDKLDLHNNAEVVRYVLAHNLM
jgi:DNA-binding NarL/FixJ family response regulator